MSKVQPLPIHYFWRDRSEITTACSFRLGSLCSIAGGGAADRA